MNLVWTMYPKYPVSRLTICLAADEDLAVDEDLAADEDLGRE